mgnify:FL=1
MFSTNDSAQKVTDFYKKELADNGWKVESTYQSTGATVIGASKDGRGLAITIASTEGVTNVTIGVENPQK